MVGRVLIEALVWTMPDEMVFVLAQHAAGVVFVVDQQPVGALGSDAMDKAFRERVRPRRPRRSLDHLNALGDEHRVEGPAELGVSIPNQEEAPG